VIRWLLGVSLVRILTLFRNSSEAIAEKDHAVLSTWFWRSIRYYRDTDYSLANEDDLWCDIAAKEELWKQMKKENVTKTSLEDVTNGNDLTIDQPFQDQSLVSKELPALECLTWKEFDKRFGPACLVD